MMDLPVSDELAIRNLLSRYVHYVDDGDPEAWAVLFTPDGTWARLNAPPRALGGSGLPQETIRGHAELAQLIRTVQARFGGLSRHQMTDVVVEAGETPDIAHMQSRAIITDWSAGLGKLAMVADYQAQLHRTAEGWRIVAVTCAVVPR
jgi:hypothetical protein